MQTFLVDFIDGIGSEEIAKLWALIIFLVGYAWLLIPHKMMAGYVTTRKGNFEAQNLLAEAMGASCLSVGVMALAALIYKVDPIEVIGWSGLVWCLVYLKWILQGSLEKAEGRLDTTLVSYLTCPILSYACFNKLDWAELYAKVLILFYTLTALVGVIAPSLGIWYYALDYEKAKNDHGTHKTLHGMSSFVLGHELYAYLLLTGVAPDKALAYATIPGMTHFFWMLYTIHNLKDEEHKSRFLKSGYYFWIGLDTLMICLILFLQKGAVTEDATKQE